MKAIGSKSEWIFLFLIAELGDPGSYKKIDNSCGVHPAVIVEIKGRMKHKNCGRLIAVGQEVGSGEERQQICEFWVVEVDFNGRMVFCPFSVSRKSGGTTRASTSLVIKNGFIKNCFDKIQSDHADSLTAWLELIRHQQDIKDNK